MKVTSTNNSSEDLYSKDWLAVKTAHDLRTPLNTILGFSQMLMLKEGDTDKKHQLKAIHQAGETLLSLINQIATPSAAKTKKKHSYGLDLNSVHFTAADIIIADEAKQNRELMSAFLQNWPFSLREAENGQVLLNMVDEQKPDLILTGIKMPILDGYHATKRLKQNLKTQDIPVIAVTALLADQIEKNGSSIFHDYLIKPFDLSDLIRAMMTVLSFEQSGGEKVVDEEEELPLTREVVAELPDSVRLQMYKAIVIGDFSQLRDLVEQMGPEQDKIAKGIQLLVEQYDQVQLLALFGED